MFTAPLSIQFSRFQLSYKEEGRGPASPILLNHSTKIIYVNDRCVCFSHINSAWGACSRFWCVSSTSMSLEMGFPGRECFFNPFKSFVGPKTFSSKPFQNQFAWLQVSLLYSSNKHQIPHFTKIPLYCHEHLIKLSRSGHSSFSIVLFLLMDNL